jgi:hypothetical protein
MYCSALYSAHATLLVNIRCFVHRLREVQIKPPITITEQDERARNLLVW